MQCWTFKQVQSYCLFLLLAVATSGCYIYKLDKVQITGEPEIKSDIVGKERIFRIYKKPSIGEPYFVLQYGKVKRIKKTVSTPVMRKRSLNKPVHGILAALGLGLAGLDSQNARAQGKEERSVLGMLGLGLFIWNTYAALSDVDWSYITTSKYDSTYYVLDNNSFIPEANITINVLNLKTGHRWTFKSDKRGRLNVHVNKVVKDYTKKRFDPISLELVSEHGAKYNITFSSKFLIAYADYLKSLQPASLAVSAGFDDQSSWSPNKIIDGAEKAFLIVSLENKGKGKAFDVSLRIDKNNPSISIPERIEVGTIEPGYKVKKRLPLSASLDLKDGVAEFTILAKERRGYDARPVKLKVRTRHLERPSLEITGYRFNDGTSGFARGNNNGVIESGETIELIAFIQNTGVGISHQTESTIEALSSSVQVLRKSDALQNIAPGETKQARFALRIPRTFAQRELQVQLSVQDMLGASDAKKMLNIPVTPRSPILVYDYSIYSHDGVKVNHVSNGSEYIIEIVPRNEGDIEAKNVQVRVSVPSGTVLRESRHLIPTISPRSESSTLRFPLVIPRTFSANNLSIQVQMTQDDFDPVQNSILLPFHPRKPELTLTQTRFLSLAGETTIRQGDYGELNIVLQNSGNLEARGVKAKFLISDPGIDVEESEFYFGNIPPGKTVPHKFRFYVKNSAKPGAYHAQLVVSQEDGFSGMNKSLTLQIAEAGAYVVEVQGEERTDKFSMPTRPVLIGRAPVVKVKARGVNELMQTFEPFVKIEISIEDDKPILGLEPEIFVGGRRQTQETLLRGIDLREKEQEAGTNRLVFVRRVPLEEGWNDIEVRFLDSDNLEGRDLERVEYVSARTNIYALIIGISDYQQNDIERLKYAHKDAQKFYDFLRSESGGKVPADNIRLLINEEATRGNILRSFREILGKALENDVVYLYMAMHAIPDPSGEPLFFLAYDSDAGNLWETAIEESGLRTSLQSRARSNKIIWITDVCHAGTIGTSMIAMRGARASRVNQLLNRMAKARNGMALFMAASANEVSQESDKWGGGVFTHYLIRGLRGEADENRDGFVYISELERYIRRAVPEATNGAQHPEVSGNFDRNLMMGVVR